MKDLKHILGFCVAVAGLCGCSSNEVPVFDTSYSALNVWFGTTGYNSVLESTSYNYSYTLGEDSVMFFARVAGLPVDYDRSFTLEAVDGNLEEAEGSYRVETYTIKAGEVEVECPIYFDTSKLKDDELFSSEEEEGSLSFQVVEDGTFASGAESLQTLVVILRNYLAKPDEWDTRASMYALAWSGYFGEYSKVKYQFMIQYTGLIDFHISYYATVPYDEETNTISTTYATYLRDKLRLYLEEYNADPNNTDAPLRDETGSLVTF